MHKTKSKNLGKRFQFWKSLPEVRAQPCTREQLIARSVFYLRPGAGEFLWLKRHVGQRSDKARKQPNCHAGRRLREPPLARLNPLDLPNSCLPIYRFSSSTTSAVVVWLLLGCRVATRTIRGNLAPTSIRYPCPPPSSRTILPTNALASPNSIRLLSR
jgi:hypothetical protein